MICGPRGVLAEIATYTNLSEEKKGWGSLAIPCAFEEYLCRDGITPLAEWAFPSNILYSILPVPCSAVSFSLRKPCFGSARFKEPPFDKRHKNLEFDKRSHKMPQVCNICSGTNNMFSVSLLFWCIFGSEYVVWYVFTFWIFMFSHFEFRLLVCFGNFGCREPSDKRRFGKNDVFCAWISVLFLDVGRSNLISWKVAAGEFFVANAAGLKRIKMDVRCADARCEDVRCEDARCEAVKM